MQMLSEWDVFAFSVIQILSLRKNHLLFKQS